MHRGYPPPRQTPSQSPNFEGKRKQFFLFGGRGGGGVKISYTSPPSTLICFRRLCLDISLTICYKWLYTKSLDSCIHVLLLTMRRNGG